MSLGLDFNPHYIFFLVIFCSQVLLPFGVDDHRPFSFTGNGEYGIFTGWYFLSARNKRTIDFKCGGIVRTGNPYFIERHQSTPYNPAAYSWRMITDLNRIM